MRHTALWFLKSQINDDGVGRWLQKRSSLLSGKNVTPSVTAPGDSNLSDTTAGVTGPWTWCTCCLMKATEFGEITQTWGLLRRSTSSKVTDFGTYRKLICNFVIVIYSNLHHILHRFRDIAFDRSKIAILCYPSPTREALSAVWLASWHLQHDHSCIFVLHSL